MSETLSPSTAPALVAEVRDTLAQPFAEWIGERTEDAIELLEAQLAAAPGPEQWKPLRGAIALLAAARGSLGPAVAREVAKRFDAKLHPDDAIFGKTGGFSLETMTLVADDQVREEIAIGNCAKRLREQLGEELFTLTQRLASILHVESLPDERNPAFPRIFARGLYDALSAMEADPSTRLAAFSAFGPVMLDAIREVYLRANRLLISHGILPDYKRSFGAPTQKPSRGLPPATTSADALQAAPATASPLERLLGAGSRATTAAPSAAGEAAPAAPGMVTIQVRPELLTALRNLEAHLTAGSPDAPEWSAWRHPASAEIHRAKRVMAATLTPSDAIVTDVVAALFDRLFADRRLPDAAKAQVARLQLPVLKTILNDHSFFTEPSHPIRHVIDTIAELGACDPGILVDDCTPEEWIAASVQNIVDGPVDDTDLWVRESERLAGALERHHDASLAADPEVLALREQERALSAVREATLAIAHRVEAAHASDDAASFLYRRWRDVMVQDYLEYGDGSEEWQQDLQVVDDLVWVLEPRAAGEERVRLAALLPTLIFRMKLGFVRAGVDGHVSLERIEALRSMLDGVVRAPAPAPRARSSPPMPVDDYTATLHTSGPGEEGFGRGSWFEFREPDGSTRRCRLSWMSPVQGVCVFKDLEQNRSFAVGLAELAERRRAGSAVQVDGPGVAASSVDAALADVARTLDADRPILPRNPN